VTAAVARRTVLLAMPPLPIAATATLSPAAVLAAGPDHLVTFGREIARLVAAIVATRAAGIPGLRPKVDLLCDAFERDIDRARELVASLALDLAALDAAGSG